MATLRDPAQRDAMLGGVENIMAMQFSGWAPSLRLDMAWRAADESPLLATFVDMARAAAPAEGERGRRGPAPR